MAWPTDGIDGWESLGATEDSLGHEIDTEPVSLPLPETITRCWYDPTALNGGGGLRPSVSLAYGTARAVARGNLEVTLTETEIFGFSLLDSVGVFAANCSLTLTVYDDDRETVLFEVSTNPEHPNPYLEEIESYGEQQVDFVNGAASLASVTVTVVDKPLIPGDQDGGYMTALLARTIGELVEPNIAGRRCRLTRFISEELGEQVVADGPAGTPSMHRSYSAYSWEIRDTRETEREVKLFQYAGTAATGLRSLVPDELMDGYGYDADSNTYLIRPAIPLQGHVRRAGAYPSPAVIEVSIGASEFPAQLGRLRIWQEAYDAVVDGIGRAQGLPFPNLDFTFRWRIAESSDEWTEVPGNRLGVSLSTNPSTTTEGARVVGQVIIEDRALEPLGPDYVPGTIDLPEEDAIIEFFLIGSVPVGDKHPVILDSKVVPGVAGPLNPTAATLLGRFQFNSSIDGFTAGIIDLLATPGNDETLRRQTVPVYDRLDKEFIPFPDPGDIFIPHRGTFKWREAGSGDPFTEITLQPAVAFGSSLLVTLLTPLSNTYRIFTSLTLTAPDADMPAPDQDIEFTVVYELGAPELSDLSVGVTAGQVAKNVYDGLYAPRGVDGEFVPLRVRYDEEALLAMTQPVRLRLTEAVDDARDWLEKFIYAPTGWAPALDQDGRISPISQVTPALTRHLPAVTNDNAEPSPDWDGGQTVYNIVRFTYNRDYVYPDDDPSAYPDPTQSDPADPLEERQKVVRAQPVREEESDTDSIARYGEKEIEFDGSCFTAIGVIPDSDQELTLPPRKTTSLYRIVSKLLHVSPVTSTPIVRSAVYTQPISGDQANEEGSKLFQLRQTHVLNRMSQGAPTVSLAVRRSVLQALRSGSWVILDLSWFPDYVTRRRNLLALAQVTSIGDLNCAWRQITAEMVTPLEPES